MLGSMLEEKLVKLLRLKYRIMSFDKESRRLKIRKSIRSKISGTKERPRISVFRSNKSIYSQIIDDTNGHTLVSSSSSDVKRSGTLLSEAEAVASEIVLYSS